MPGSTFPNRPTFADWQARAGDLGLERKGNQLEGPCPVCGGTDCFSVNRRGILQCRKCNPGKRTQAERDAYRAILDKADFALPDTPEAKEERRAVARERQKEEAAIDARLDRKGLDQGRFADEWSTMYADSWQYGEHFRFLENSPARIAAWIKGDGWATGPRATAAARRSMRGTIEVLCDEETDLSKRSSLRQRWVNNATVSGALRLAADQEWLLRPLEEWDNDPHVVGLPAGYSALLDVEADEFEGLIELPDPYRFQLRRLPAQPDPNHKADSFRELLDTITQCDEEYETALQAVRGFPDYRAGGPLLTHSARADRDRKDNPCRSANEAGRRIHCAYPFRSLYRAPELGTPGCFHAIPQSARLDMRGTRAGQSVE